MDGVSATTPTAPMTSAMETYKAKADANMRLLRNQLDLQEDVILQLLESMNIGQNVDFEA